VLPRRRAARPHLLTLPATLDLNHANRIALNNPAALLPPLQRPGLSPNKPIDQGPFGAGAGAGGGWGRGIFVGGLYAGGWVDGGWQGVLGGGEVGVRRS
jgi:hypothetical protein